jgi:hypothetical protein
MPNQSLALTNMDSPFRHTFGGESSIRSANSSGFFYQSFPPSAGGGNVSSQMSSDYMNCPNPLLYKTELCEKFTLSGQCK